jgi:hypothetical protein
MSTDYPEVGSQSFGAESSLTADGRVDVVLRHHLADDVDTQRYVVTVKIGRVILHEFTVRADEIEVYALD